MNDTTKGNILIAEFMGMTYDNHDDQPNPYWELTDEQPFTSNEPYPQNKHLKFHNNWNWLMSAVEKIESLGHGVTIYRNGCHINDVKLFGVNGFNHKSKIEQTYKAVLEFIEWYKSKN